MMRQLDYLAMVLTLAFAAGCGDPGRATQQPGDKDAPSHLLLQVVQSEDVFTLEKATRVPSALPKSRSESRIYAWRLRVIDSDGNALFERGMENPAALRGDHTHIGVEQPVDFTVRVPELSQCTATSCEVAFHSLASGTPRSSNPEDNEYIRIGSVPFRVE